MLISIGHVTRYTYADPARYTIQTLRLTPPSFAGQRVIDWNITAPGMERTTKFRDGFGNMVDLVTYTAEHTDIVLIARGLVETEDRSGLVRGLVEPAPVRVYLRVTDRTIADDAIKDIAASAATGSDVDRLHRLMHAVRDAVDYKIGATSEHTNAAEAVRDGKGVCQDHAHVFIAAARTLGFPSRYVNGYMLPDDEGPSEAHHAWAEAYVNGLGWVGFDPANRLCPTDHYVRLACGLDAATAAPIRGTRRGGEKETLDVIVEVQQANSQQ
ncbi:MAG: transglutaminase family protein [Hyphomicrobium sp.]